MSLNLDENLISRDSPSADVTSSLDYNSTNDRNNVTDYNFNSINANKITAGTIGGSVIYGGTITGDQLRGGTLALGGTANGDGVMLINNAAGTTIVRGDNLGHHYYNTGGTELVRVNDEGLYGFGTVENVVTLQDSVSGTTVYGKLGLTSGSSSFFIQSASNKNLYMLSAGNMLITGGTDVIMSAANDWTVLSDHFYLTSNGRGTVQSSGNLLLAATDGTADINIEASDDVNINCDVFRINGAGKTAVLDTSKGYRELYCMESPEVWFMDFCDTKDLSLIHI